MNQIQDLSLVAAGVQTAGLTTDDAARIAAMQRDMFSLNHTGVAAQTG
jgi:hypothetical protein